MKHNNVMPIRPQMMVFDLLNNCRTGIMKPQHRKPTATLKTATAKSGLRFSPKRPNMGMNVVKNPCEKYAKNTNGGTVQTMCGMTHATSIGNKKTY